MSPHAAIAKIPFIALNTLCAQTVFTSPVPPPHPEEQAKFVPSHGAYEKGRFTFLHAVKVMKPIFHILNFVEALAILTTACPNLLDALPTPYSDAFARLLIVSHLGITSVFITGITIMYPGSALRYAAYHHLGRFFTFQLAVRKDHKLVTDGPYGVVRHPSYTGAIAYMIGIAICQLGPGSFWLESGAGKGVLGVIASAFYVALLGYISGSIVLRTAKEDAILRAEFGEQRDVWASKTRYRLLPYVY